MPPSPSTHDGDHLDHVVALLTERVKRELVLIEEQIVKSRLARGAAEHQPPTPAKQQPQQQQQREAAPPVTTSATSSLSLLPPSSSVAAASPPLTSSATQEADSAKVDPQSLNKMGGTLLNYGRPRVFQSFTTSYVQVDATTGISWWDSEDDFRRNPTKPKDSVPFYEITTNSRASKFKKAMTAWPLILKEDCAKATDDKIVYFGVEYYNPKSQKPELLVLGAKSSTERDDWVRFLTKYVKLFLATREESTEFIDFPVGSVTPVHVSCVLDGEAPR